MPLSRPSSPVCRYGVPSSDGVYPFASFPEISLSKMPVAEASGTGVLVLVPVVRVLPRRP